MANKLDFIITADAKQGVAGVNKFKTSAIGAAGGAGAAFSKMLPAINPVTAAIGAAAIAAAALYKGISKSLEVFEEFEVQLTNVSTLFDSTPEYMKKFQKELMALDSHLGSTTKLTAGLYQAISARGSLKDDPKKAAAFIAEAAKAAKAGLTDTFTAVDALTTMLNAYGLKSTEITAISDQMFTAVKDGKTTFDELATSIGRVAPVASAAGVGSKELLASIATITKSGVKTSEAMSSLKQAFSNIAKPNTDAKDLIQELGIEFDAAALKSQGFTKFVGNIEEATGGSFEMMTKLFGSIEAVNTMVILAGKGADDYRASMENMAKATGATNEAFEKQTSTYRAAKESLSATFEKVGIIIGEKIAPGLTKIVNLMSEWLSQKETLDALREVLSVVAQAFRILGNNADTAQNVLSPLKVVIELIVLSFKGWWEILKLVLDLLEWTSEAISNLTQNIEDFVDWVITSVKELGLLTGSLEVISTSAGAVSDAFVASKDGVVNATKVTGKAISNMSGATVDGMKSAAGAVNDFSLNTTNAIAGTTVKGFNKGTEAVKDFGKSVGETSKTLLKGIKIPWLGEGSTVKPLGEKIEDIEPTDTVDDINDMVDALLKFNKESNVLSGTVKQFRDIAAAMDESSTAAEINALSMEQLRNEMKYWFQDEELIVKFLGEGSTVKPLTEKIDELSRKLFKFADGVEENSPKVTVSFEDQNGRHITESLNIYKGDFVNFFSSIVEGTASVEDAFRNMTKDILKTIYRMMISKAVGKFISMVGGAFGGMGATPYVPALAGGGIATAGKAHLVGERGPELFVPGQTGRVFPKASGGITVNNNVVVKAPGGSQQDNQRMGDVVAKMIDERTRMTLYKETRAGGILAQGAI